MKITKGQKLAELGNKMKELENDGVLDLNKLRVELMRKEREIGELQQTSVISREKIDTIRRNYEIKIEMGRTNFRKEKQIKDQAIRKLEDTQLEFNIAQEGDAQMWKDK